MWQPALISGEPDRLLGYEVLTSPFAPVAEAGKPFIAFGDFKYYNIGDRGTRSFQELKELFAGNGMVGYVAKERVDGKLILPEAVQLLTAGGCTASDPEGNCFFRFLIVIRAVLQKLAAPPI